jgi:hypothetical protein
MRRADYTVDGQLTIHVHADTTSRDNGQPGDVTCYVTSAGGRSTIGSVVGLGSAQLTFAG